MKKNNFLQSYLMMVCLSWTCFIQHSSAELESAKVDQYGGYLNLPFESKGRFYLDKLDGRHYLVTPDGHGFISLGVTHTGSVLRAGSQSYDFFKEKFKSHHMKVNRAITQQLKSWSYNSLGYDNNLGAEKLMPFMASCSTTSNSMWSKGHGFQYEDIFSQAWRAKAKKAIERMVTNAKEKHLLIGYYWTDMPAWNLKHSKRALGQHWVDYIRSLPDQSEGKKVYHEFLKTNAGKEDDQKFLGIMAREYYRFIGELTKSLDPNALIFGERYNGSALDHDVIREALPYIDVISIQPNSDSLMEIQFDRLYSKFKKPIMVCDHQCSFPTKEHPKTMWRQFKTVEEVNQAHRQYFKELFAKPYAIGYHRCQYIDRVQGAVLKQGLVNKKGEPYEKLIENVRMTNQEVHRSFKSLKVNESNSDL